MMKIQPAFKVTILPMIKAALKLTRENLPALITLSWLVMFLYLIKLPLDYYFSIAWKTEQWLQDLTNSYGLSHAIVEILFLLYDSLLIAILSYGLLTFFIRGADLSQKYEYNRGIELPKTLLTLKWFISLAKPVWIIFAISMIIGIIFFAFGEILNLATMKYMESKMHIADYDYTNLAYARYAASKLIFVAEELTYAAIILAWPAIILGSFQLSGIADYIKPLKGNITRLTIIGILIFIPAYLISGAYSGIMTMIAYMNHEIPMWMTGIFYEVISFIISAVFFISFIIYNTFIGLFYKTLKDGGKI